MWLWREFHGLMAYTKGCTPQRNLYGRRKGPPLRDRPSRLMNELYPRLAIAPEGPIAPTTLFPASCNRFWLEVGFGKGEHLVAQAQAHPEIGMIGCEPYLNGMAACLGQIEVTAVDTVRLYHGDALDVLERLPDNVLDKVIVLHPDPWPKARHAKRRFINDGPLEIIAAKLKPDGELRIGTDHPIYLEHTLQVMQQRPDFTWTAERMTDWSRRPPGWIETRYEAWALSEGRPVWYLSFIKR